MHVSMEEEKLWSIVEFAMRDLELSHTLLMSLIHCLPFPVNPKPPPHILRLALLRNLLSASVSHRLLSPFALETLERLLPPPTAPPSPSLCTAYSSHLFYLSTAPGFSVEVDAVLSRLSNYCFAMKLLDPWRAMVAKQQKNIALRDKAIIALRDFVDEELRAMEPPFLMRSHQELCKGLRGNQTWWMEADNENSPPARRVIDIESQEPDELSQIDALNAVDRFLSFQEVEEKKNRCRGLLHYSSVGVVTETNSELNLSARVVKYLSHQHNDKYLVRNMDVFDWVDASLEERFETHTEKQLKERHGFKIQ